MNITAYVCIDSQGHMRTGGGDCFACEESNWENGAGDLIILLNIILYKLSSVIFMYYLFKEELTNIKKHISGQLP